MMMIWEDIDHRDYVDIDKARNYKQQIWFICFCTDDDNEDCAKNEEDDVNDDCVSFIPS